MNRGILQGTKPITVQGQLEGSLRPGGEFGGTLRFDSTITIGNKNVDNLEVFLLSDDLKQYLGKRVQLTGFPVTLDSALRGEYVAMTGPSIREIY